MKKQKLDNRDNRLDERSADELRSIVVTYNTFGYGDGSVLFELGKTKVLCTVSLSPGVPPFLRGSGTGWLTAEYGMLPTATHTRTQRESGALKKSGRSVEISRLIGRSLRAIVDLKKLKDCTITVDCDVLQADGGTRTACITGAYLALCQAQKQWLERKQIGYPVIMDALAAISVGVKDDTVLLDLNYEEDCSVDADYNFVLTKSGSIIEIQGTAEYTPVSWELFDRIRHSAINGIKSLFTYLDSQVFELEEKKGTGAKALPLFSLRNRQHMVNS